MPTEITDEQYRRLATAKYTKCTKSVSIDIDKYARVRVSPSGAWVAAWVWIDEPRDTGEEKP